ncbi:flavin reductase family protein [Micromonospora marina]|uniref:flavin reductase family protein n=1 Tax=Micromonospora marina TaxID=307120 RepID=UPI003456E74E
MAESAIGFLRPGLPPLAQHLREVMRHYPTGVVVVAAVHGGHPHGMAVNSFASVSLDPPLVMFCADHRSSTWPTLREAGRFAVSVLAADQVELCRTFATKGADRFSGQQWSPAGNGAPVLDEAVVWLACTIEVVHPGGDHDIVIGRVQETGHRPDRRPLIFHRGDFTSVAA